MIAEADKQYQGLPWKLGGRDRAGVDCVGLAYLWLQEQMGFQAPLSADWTKDTMDCEPLLPTGFDETWLERGDVIFFRRAATGKVQHVAIWLGDGQLLHILGNFTSRIDRGFTLLRRLGCEPVAAISPKEADRLCCALSDAKLGWETVALIAVSLALSAVSYLLLPKQPRLGNKYGRYGFDALATQNSPEVPLPNLLGTVTIAGNSPYTQLSDKNAETGGVETKANKAIVLGSGPHELVDYFTGLKVNGLSWSDAYWHDGSNLEGFTINPAQTKAEAVTGTIAGDADVPSISIYDGAHGISVPVDVRAQYDRTFPLYGFAGCGYVVMRLVDPAKYSNLNFTCRVKGRKCRTFDEDGFIRTTVTAESLTGADGSKVRFKLAHDDIAAVTSLTVNGTPYTLLAPGNQTGNVFHLNATKGYVEFLTAPAAATTIEITYTYFPRVWSQNPAMHVVYLLTEKRDGKGFAESRINWARAVDHRDYCDEVITWVTSEGSFTGPRYTTNYAIDFRKPIQEHLAELINACHSYLFVSGGKWVIKARKSEASVMSFDSSNIMVKVDGRGRKSTFQREYLDRTERPNQIHVLFHSDEAFNAEDEAVRDDYVDQEARATRTGGDGVVPENLKFAAVDNFSQADRLAEITLRESVRQGSAITLLTNIQGLPLEPGDVVDLTRPTLGWTDKLFRIEDLSFDANDRLTVKAVEYVEAAI